MVVVSFQHYFDAHKVDVLMTAVQASVVRENQIHLSVIQTYATQANARHYEATVELVNVLVNRFFIQIKINYNEKEY